jgi:hypothetical protein
VRYECSVKLPYDSSVDLYKNPWITRYLYDLTGNSYTFEGVSFSAYGNLFETEELLPSTSTVQTGELTIGSLSNPDYEGIKATAYDGADRPVARYSGLGVGSSCIKLD